MKGENNRRNHKMNVLLHKDMEITVMHVIVYYN